MLTLKLPWEIISARLFREQAELLFEGMCGSVLLFQPSNLVHPLSLQDLEIEVFVAQLPVLLDGNQDGKEFYLQKDEDIGN